MLSNPDIPLLLLIALAGFYAGTQNTLAGGGSFITFPTLLLAGLDPLSANITSTIALFPNQITSALSGRKLAGGVGALSLGKFHGSLRTGNGNLSADCGEGKQAIPQESKCRSLSGGVDGSRIRKLRRGRNLLKILASRSN